MNSDSACALVSSREISKAVLGCARTFAQLRCMLLDATVSLIVILSKFNIVSKLKLEDTPRQLRSIPSILTTLRSLTSAQIRPSIRGVRGRAAASRRRIYARSEAAARGPAACARSYGRSASRYFAVRPIISCAWTGRCVASEQVNDGISIPAAEATEAMQVDDVITSMYILDSIDNDYV
ncbi:hypothetical protein EVAR_41925_1 [Eumeta japonica]|uniref:Uncharacterized protein n=1 Tax=Eumeta variegata TaxID=151549 RepID=A0A4C1XM34_EUMVA|nr:hypothetical protein EVAR_41925_1 [Eumeta japonica]